jgi:hypothetical protein
LPVVAELERKLEKAERRLLQGLFRYGKTWNLSREERRIMRRLQREQQPEGLVARGDRKFLVRTMTRERSHLNKKYRKTLRRYKKLLKKMRRYERTSKARKARGSQRPRRKAGEKDSQHAASAESSSIISSSSSSSNHKRRTRVFV